METGNGRKIETTVEVMRKKASSGYAHSSDLPILLHSSRCRAVALLQGQECENGECKHQDGHFEPHNGPDRKAANRMHVRRQL